MWCPLNANLFLDVRKLPRPAPTVTLDSEELLILIPQIASLPASVLKRPIVTQEHMRDKIVAALDFAMVGFGFWFWLLISVSNAVSRRVKTGAKRRFLRRAALPC
ncbi:MULTISPECIES: CcdB family protein [Halomonas]|uniref:CcdB family protein n=1 Tax=Halomonas TaxID=2745 RepID=UPI0035C238C8